MKSRKGILWLSVLLLLIVFSSLLAYTNSASSQGSASTNQSSELTYPKRGEEGPVVMKDAHGNTTAFGDYDTKQTASDGKVLQWYQGFGDADGKCLIDIVRAGAGNDIPTHDGIQLIIYRIYRSDGNIAEKYE